MKRTETKRSIPRILLSGLFAFNDREEVRLHLVANIFLNFEIDEAIGNREVCFVQRNEIVKLILV